MTIWATLQITDNLWYQALFYFTWIGTGSLWAAIGNPLTLQLPEAAVPVGAQKKLSKKPERKTWRIDIHSGEKHWDIPGNLDGLMHAQQRSGGPHLSFTWRPSYSAQSRLVNCLLEFWSWLPTHTHIHTHTRLLAKAGTHTTSRRWRKSLFTH